MCKFFSALPTFIKRNQDKELLEISRIFKVIYSPGVWVSRFGCRFEYLLVSWSYGLSKTDEALNLKQYKFWVRNNSNNNGDCSKNDPRMANIYVSNSSCYCPSTAVSLVQDSMPLRFLCELKKFAQVSSHISSQRVIVLRNFCVIQDRNQMF